MICELKGGPLDGALVDIEVGSIGDSPWIDDDFEMYFPHDGTPGGQIEPISTYRWLFGAADHLDFAGWQPPHVE